MEILNIAFDKIITVTLNPSLDATLWIDKLDLDEPVKCKREQYYPGGKGLNVSRVLTALSVENTAVCITGRENSAQLKALLDMENVCYDFLPNDGFIRENLSIVTAENKMLKINRQGFFVEDENIKKLREKIIGHVKAANAPIVVFAGSLPQNVNKECYKKLAMEIKSLGAFIVLDNDIFSHDDLKEIAPFLIKPNCLEIAHMFGKSAISLEECTAYAKCLSEAIPNVLVSLGGEGLLYCSEVGIIKATVPKVEIKSTVGAGDSTLAGFIAAIFRGKSADIAVKYAAACGTASVTLEGTQTLTQKLAEEIFAEVKISFLDR